LLSVGTTKYMKVVDKKDVNAIIKRVVVVVVKVKAIVRVL